MATFYRLAADAVVLVHFSYVAFVVVGLAAILLGLARRWGWVRNVWFRSLHLLAILVVAAEAVCGITCPLCVSAPQTVDEGDFMLLDDLELTKKDANWQLFKDLSTCHRHLLMFSLCANTALSRNSYFEWIFRNKMVFTC